MVGAENQVFENRGVLLANFGNGALTQKDVKNEDCSSEFIENKGEKKCSSEFAEKKRDSLFSR
jgi:hypothetical protein